MEEIQQLAKRFYIFIETYKPIEDSQTNWIRTVTREDLWTNLFNYSFDNGKLRDFFITLNLESREAYLYFGIACCVCFVQLNFTGPELPQAILDFLFRDPRKRSIDFATRLSMNGEEVNPNTKFPVLLVAAEIIFDSCIVNDLINLWWCCRALMIHQQILDELSPTLLANADRLHKLIESVNLEGQLKAELDIELAILYLKFRHVSKSKDHITSATNILGLEYKLSGKLGKRTKFQENEIAQLVLEINLHKKEGIERPEVCDIEIPKNLNLNDDVRLDQIEYSEENAMTRLTNTEQKLLLAIVEQNLKAKPVDELHTEEVLPFLEAVLAQKSTYSVRVMALLLRCKLEDKSRRTIERCLKQCESIISSYKDPKPNISSRFGDIFGVGLLPIWNVEAQYATILLNLGLVKNSLDVFLKLKLWEEVIVCYTVLQLKHKAAEVIKEQLEVKPTVKLMCLLGKKANTKRHLA